MKTRSFKTEGLINLGKLKKPAALCISIIFILSIFAASTSRADSSTTSAGTLIPVGGSPSGVAFASSNDDIYVTGTSRSVSVISTLTNTVVNTISVGVYPQGIAYASSNDDVYVANAISNTVSVISTVTNTVVGSPIPVGNQPWGVAFAPSNGDIYVTNYGDGTVSVISTLTNMVVGSPIPVGSRPWGVAFAPSNGDIYVTNAGSNTVSVISTLTNMVVGSPIPVGNGPFGVAFASSNGDMYVTNVNDGTVSVISTLTNMVVGSPIPVGNGPFGVAFASSNGDIYVVNERGSNTVSVISTLTNTVVRSPIAVGNWPTGVAYASNGDIYVANYGDGTVSVIPTSATFFFSSGFENGFSSWTTTYGGVSIVSSPVYQGNYAMVCSDPWGSQVIESIGVQSETYGEAEFYFDQNFAGSQRLIAYFDGNGNPAVSMGISVQSGNLFAFVQTSLPSYSYSQYQLTGITPGTWVKFALDASATSATIYLNDQQLTSISQNNIPSTASVGVGMFWGDGSYSGNLYVDNVQIGTSSPVPTPTPTRTSLFSSGFEDGFNSWTAKHGGVFLTSLLHVYAGYYAMVCSDPWGSQAIESIGMQSETYAEAEFNFDQNFTGSQTLIACFNGNGDPTVSMGISVQLGKLFAFVQTNLPSYSYSQYQLASLTPGTWVKFALDASTTSATIYLNDQQLTSISQNNIPSTASVGVGMFWGDGSYSGNLYVDNVQIETPNGWSQTFEGLGYAGANSVVQTSDGGYAIAGSTGTLADNSSDVYLVKTDSAGTVLWRKTYGGPGSDSGSSVIQSSDGGYAIAGSTSSFGAGGSDVYLVKTDSAGTMIWNKTYGGASDDVGQSIVQSPDGGYAIAGTTYSTSPHNTSDPSNVYFVKTDSLGNMLWNETYGGYGRKQGYSVVQTSDGGYAIAGGFRSPGHLGVYLVKTDGSGNMQWDKSYGETGTMAEIYTHWGPAYSVVQSSDGGYALAGTAQTSRYGDSVFLIKTDVSGNYQWNKTYGGNENVYPEGSSIIQSSDGGYVIAGSIRTSYPGQHATPDISSDVYLVKTDVSGNLLWSKTFGGAEYQVGSSVVQSSDGGYVIAGSTYSSYIFIEYPRGSSFSYAYLVKTDDNGNLLSTR